MIRTDAHLFEIAARFASTEETRYYLNGVYVEPHPCGGVNLVATDGHRLFIAYDAFGEATAPAIVRLSKAALKACKPSASDRKHGVHCTLTVNIEGLATVLDNNGCVAASDRQTIIDGRFPDYRRVLPRTQDATGAPGSFNPKYLAEFAKAGSDLHPNGLGNIGLRGADEGAPHSVHWDGVENAMGVLMPVRSAHGGQRPAFIDATPNSTPIVTLTPTGQHHHRPDPMLSFTISVQRSPLHPSTERAFRFASTAQARRAYNRVLVGLHLRGQCLHLKALPRAKAGFELLWDQQKIDAALMQAEREARMDAARETFEKATDADLHQPWRLHLVTDGAEPHDREWRMRSLRDISEARILAAAYGAAA